jgi:hypothetical protein
VAACLFVFLALPLLLFHCLVLLASYIWANVTVMSLAMTPVMSRAGLAVWMLLKVYLIIGGDLYRGTYHGHCYMGMTVDILFCHHHHSHQGCYLLLS